MKRWKPSAPLAQIPLCTHKHRNSSKITKKEKKRKARTFFSHPHDPKSFPNAMLRRNVFRKGEMWRSLLGLVHWSLVKNKSLWWTVCVCVYFFRCTYVSICTCVCVRAKGGRGVEAGGESLMRNRLRSPLPLLGLGAQDESVAEVEVWVQVLESLSERLLALRREGTAAASLLWVSAVRSMVPVTSHKNKDKKKAAWCQLRMRGCKHVPLSLERKN